MAKERPGKLRLNKLSRALLRTGGILTADTSMAVLHDSKQAVSRTVGRLENAGVLVRARIAGQQRQAYLSRRSWVTEQRGSRHLSGDRVLRGSIDNTFQPGQRFEHNQRCSQVLYALAGDCPEDFITREELEATKHLWRGRLPDGVVRLRPFYDPRYKVEIIAVEVELSPKSGSDGGWAEIARYIMWVCSGYGQQTALGDITAVMIVGQLGYAKSIAKKVTQLLEKKLEKDPYFDFPVYFYFCEIDEDGTFAPVLVWEAGRDEPLPIVYWMVWTPGEEEADGESRL